MKLRAGIFLDAKKLSRLLVPSSRRSPPAPSSNMKSPNSQPSPPGPASASHYMGRCVTLASRVAARPGMHRAVRCMWVCFQRDYVTLEHNYELLPSFVLIVLKRNKTTSVLVSGLADKKRKNRAKAEKNKTNILKRMKLTYKGIICSK